MFSIPIILVPVLDSGTFADSPRLGEQIAWLAERFQSEVILLHVVSGFDHPAGLLERGHEITARDMRASVVQVAESDLAHMSPPEFAGIAITRILLRGEPAAGILQTALDRDVSLIVLPAPDDPAFFSFLTGSVTKKVLCDSACPIWTGAHPQQSSKHEFSVRRILCSVELTSHNRHTVAAAAEIAAAVGAELTLVHITSGVEAWGPGGTHIDKAWQGTLVGIADKEIAELQRELGTQAEVIIDSGNAPELLNRIAERTNADLLIVGRTPGRSHLGDNGQGIGIIRESRVPVLSV
jgi:nucleotide-binding universal stress UspA family protein